MISAIHPKNNMLNQKLKIRNKTFKENFLLAKVQSGKYPLKMKEAWFFNQYQALIFKH